MLINAQPKKFNVIFKGEEIKLVQDALAAHRDNPDTRSSTIERIDKLIKIIGIFPKPYALEILDIKAIIYGIAVIVANDPIAGEKLEAALHMISALNGALRQNVPAPILCPYPVYCFVSTEDNH